MTSTPQLSLMPQIYISQTMENKQILNEFLKHSCLKRKYIRIDGTLYKVQVDPELIQQRREEKRNLYKMTKGSASILSINLTPQTL